MPPQPPTFHIPIGRKRDSSGYIVPFANYADQERAIKRWHALIKRHPATLAAGACVIIGPDMTQHLNFQTQLGQQRETEPGAWQPSAVSDLRDAGGTPR